MAMLDFVALWLGRVLLIVAGGSVAAGAIYAAAYWITYAINESHHRAAAAIAGKDYLEKLRAIYASEHDQEKP